MGANGLGSCTSRELDKMHYRVYVSCGQTNNVSSASVLLLAQSPLRNDTRVPGGNGVE